MEHSAQGAREKWGEKLIPTPVPPPGLARSRGKLLIEAWKPPKPQGWSVGPSSGADEHVPCSPSEMHAGGGEVGGLRGDSSKPQGDSRAWCPLWGQDRVVHPGRHEGWVAPGAC